MDVPTLLHQHWPGGAAGANARLGEHSSSYSFLEVALNHFFWVFSKAQLLIEKK